MITIALRFPSGRYHSTPWGRNVNEGDVEWPPSTFRLARALVDVWKRRQPDWPEERIVPLLRALTGSPVFHLPLSSTAHTRSFLSSNKTESSKKELVFDAFVVIPKDACVIVGFDSKLDGDCVQDLSVLLRKLNFLGRSESWVEARLVRDSHSLDWNCEPVKDNIYLDGFEPVQLACLQGPEDYSRLSEVTSEKKVGTRTDGSGLPQSWIDAISFSTADLCKHGWSRHPTLVWRTYTRPADALIPKIKRAATSKPRLYRCARYDLVSRVLPRTQETLFVSKRVREHLMGIHKKIMGDDPKAVSWRFSGKNESGLPLTGHRHAFYQPIDEDQDGYIDHLLVHSSGPFSETELQALDRFRSIWQSEGRPDLKFVLTGLYDNLPTERSNAWVSSTPVVLNRHYRKGRGEFLYWLRKEVLRECESHGLPQPVSVEITTGVQNRGINIRWFEFARKYGPDRPILSGHGFILHFNDEIEGPFSLGSLCHFGLGQFKPYGWQFS